MRQGQCGTIRAAWLKTKNSMWHRVVHALARQWGCQMPEGNILAAAELVTVTPTAAAVKAAAADRDQQTG